MSATDQATKQELMLGADILVKSLVNHGVEVDLCLSRVAPACRSIRR